MHGMEVLAMWCMRNVGAFCCDLGKDMKSAISSDIRQEPEQQLSWQPFALSSNPPVPCEFETTP